MRPDTGMTGFAVILAAAVVTYALRAGGLLLAEHLPKKGRIKAAMEALPGTILLALIAPGILSYGLPGVLAAGVMVFLARSTGATLPAMAAGMLVIAVARHTGLGI